MKIKDLLPEEDESSERSRRNKRIRLGNIWKKGQKQFDPNVPSPDLPIERVRNSDKAFEESITKPGKKGWL